VIALLILGGGMLVTSRRRQRKPSRANALAQDRRQQARA
jgi:hypothetical protein